MNYGHNGWTHLLSPGDNEHVNNVYINRRGVVRVWHRTERGWRVVHVEPTGETRQDEGKTVREVMAACPTSEAVAS